MNKATCCVVVFCLLCFANVPANSSDFGDQLSVFRQAVADYSTADKDNTRQLNDIVAKQTVQISATLRKDTQAKELLLNEITCLAKKYDVVDPSSTPNIPSRDGMYYALLVDLLLEVDGDRFLTYSRGASKSKYMNYRFKEICFNRTLKMRLSTYVRSRKTLNDFDLVMIEICSNFLDPSNGTRSRYGLMSLRRQFVLHLLGYEIGGTLKLPAADKALGIKLAKEVIQDDNLSFIGGKGWFMEQAAKHDPDIHKQYLCELRKIAHNERLRATTRLKYARKLLELNEKLVKELEKKAGDEDKSRGQNIIKKGKAKDDAVK